MAGKRKLVKHYEIVRRLGSGGYGVVYLADDTRLLRPVVLKMLRRGSSVGAREAILREARLASAIEHPNVCSIYEVDEADGQAFIAMQYVPGRTLDKLIHAGPLPLQLALSIAVQAADGLAAAHRLGIVHRDLKPANIVLTDEGLVKILDFGLAKRKTAEDGFAAGRGRSGKNRSSRQGTVAYMAPEQFITGHSSEQSDIFAFGVILYEMVTAVHPFIQPDLAQAQVARAIQYFDPPRPSEKRAELSADFEGVILKALEKNPARRFASAAEMREALKTLMKTAGFESAIVHEAAAAIPALHSEKKPGMLSTLAERFIRNKTSDAQHSSIAVLPFSNRGKDDPAAFYGLALAEALASKIARLPFVTVRPGGSLASPAGSPIDPVEAGKKLVVANILNGSFIRSDNGFDVTWQLVDVNSNTVHSGGTVSVPSFDLVVVQNEVCDEVFARLQAIGQLQPTAPTAHNTSDAQISEDYLQARALLSNFILHSSQRNVLDEAKRKFRMALARNPDFAQAHSSLGITLLEYVRKGYGDVGNLVEAHRSFERALELDPDLVEASVFRVYTLLARGEKERARHAILHLHEMAAERVEVHLVAAFIFRMDGLYDRAISELGEALRLSPARAPVVYNDRARIYQYQGQIKEAFEEIDKGLALEPKHPLLNTSLAYAHFQQSDLDGAIAILESVLEDYPDLRIAYPTLAMCYAAAGERHRTASLITEETMIAAEADCEMSYRLATYFAVAGETAEALRWLRRSIYLGNENYPWLASNSAWEKLHGNDDFVKIIAELKKDYRSNLKKWKRLLGDRAAH